MFHLVKHIRKRTIQAGRLFSSSALSTLIFLYKKMQKCDNKYTNINSEMNVDN